MTSTAAGRFPSTHWSNILAAGGRESTESALAALSVLCEAYWYPVYAYIRRRGYDVDNARDLTQGFFTTLIARRESLRADPHRGRFRSYLLGALKHYLANERDREHARKRGGGEQLLRLDFETGEARYRLEPGDTENPETIYERRWALTVLETVLRRLGREYEQRGKGVFFRVASPLLTGDQERGAHATLSRELSMTEGAFKVAVHRMRRRYRELLRAEIAETVRQPDEVEAELRHLLAAVSG